MQNMSVGEAILIALMIGLLIVIIGCVLIAMANRHIKENRAILFEECSPLSDECLKMGLKLLENGSGFNTYIEEMGHIVTF